MKYFLFLSPLLVLAACKKHDPPPPTPPACLISQVSYTGTPISIGPTKFTYDEQGRLTRTVESDTIITTLTRAGDSVVTNTSVPRGFVSRVVFYNNKDGLTTKTHVTYNPEGTVWYDISYEYVGQELRRSHFVAFSRPDTLVTNFTWSGGNMISSTSDSAKEDFEYYTDQPRQQGDAQFFDQFTSGFEIVRTKNLIKSRHGISYTYQFRPDGKITTVTAKDTAADIFISHYDYDCK